MNQKRRRTLHAYSAVVLAGAFLVSSEMPLLAQEPSNQTTAPAQQPATQTNQSQATPDHTMQDQKPQIPQPAQNDAALPDAPQAQGQSQDQSSTPSGAAGAKSAEVKGAPVAQPAGAAVAPVKQRGHHSLLIKVGLIVGAGAAVGTAVALSAASPSRPPGATPSVR